MGGPTRIHANFSVRIPYNTVNGPTLNSTSAGSSLGMHASRTVLLAAPQSGDGELSQGADILMLAMLAGGGAFGDPEPGGSPRASRPPYPLLLAVVRGACVWLRLLGLVATTASHTVADERREAFENVASADPGR